MARLGLAEANLARFLGVDVGQTRAPNLLPVVAVGGAAEPRDTLLAEARRASPQLLAAAGRIAAAKAAEQAAGGAWWPTIRLEGRLVTYASGSSSAQTEWQAGARLSYPIFSGGSRSGAVQRASAVRREAEASYRDMDLTIVGRLDQVLANLTEAHERVAALQTAVTQWVEVVRTEALALDQGAGTQTDYLRAESDLAMGRASLAQAMAAELMANVELAQVLGTLAPETIERIVTVAH
jgi:outer membrane protein TolC